MKTLRQLSGCATRMTMASIQKQIDNYMIVDVGANLTNKKYARDVESVIKRASESGESKDDDERVQVDIPPFQGVSKIMVTGTSVQGSRDALRLSRLHPGVLYSTAGVHPHDAKSWDESSEKALRELLQNPECVAVGECGLDFNRNFSPPQTQLEVFEKQIEMACSLQKPLFLHERDAHDEMVNLLQLYKDKLPNSVIHCFTGTVDQAKKYIDLGCFIGLTGFLWKDKSENGVRRILEDDVIPLDRLVVETDAPFMYPNTRASKLPQFVKDSLTERSQQYLNRYCTFQRNEPCSLPVTVEMIAAYLKKKPEEVALATTFNALKLFPGLST